MKKFVMIMIFLAIAQNFCLSQNWIMIHSALIDRAKIITINNKRTLFFQTWGFTGAPFIGCNDSTIFRTYKLNSSTNQVYKPNNHFLDPFICTDFILTESCMFFRPDEFDVSKSDSNFVVKYSESWVGSNCSPPHIRKIVTSTGYSTPGDTASAKVIRISPFNDNTIYSIINNYLFKSVNRGQNWTAVSGTPGNLKDVIFNPFDSNYLYLISLQNQNTMLISTNSGAGFDVSAVNFSSSSSLYFKNEDTLLTYNNSNLYKSDNKGLSWSLLGTGAGNFNCLELHPGLKNVCYAGFDNLGLYVSTNGGSNFMLYNTFTPDNHVYGILKARPNKDSIYVVTGSGVYITYDQYVTGIMQTSYYIPDKFQLYNNYPNPFNPNTVISYSLNENRFTTLKIFNALGKVVAVLVNEKQTAGSHTVQFDGTNFPSGIYFYQLTAGDFSEVKKMTLLK